MSDRPVLLNVPDLVSSLAIAGIGSDNVVGIAPDFEARLDLGELDKRLQESVDAQQSVYAVVAIIGSTEEGAVDSLRGVLELRKKYQAKGLSFVVHADAAWGGYFATMIPKDFRPGDPKNAEPPAQTGKGDGFVPDASLRVDTQEDIYAMRYADSITVDPHKAGYIPYPAGSLCYRDGRMRFLITWTSPYISGAGAFESIGIYGVEGRYDDNFSLLQIERADIVVASQERPPCPRGLLIAALGWVLKATGHF